MSRKTAQFKNSAKLGAGILKSMALRKRMPLMVSFHVTNRCNMRCPYCYANYDERFENPPPDFTTEECLDIIDDFYRLGMRWLTILGGEPLLRNDIGVIVRHAKSKGVLVEIVTNGYFVKKRLDDILPVDFVCLSVEGDEEQHDRARNTPGSYRAIIDALETLKGRGPKLRLHATLLKSTIGGFDHIAELARKYGAEFGYSQVIAHDYNRTPDIDFSDDELRDFWRKLRRSKSRGLPCYNSDFVLDYISNWPAPYRKILKTEKEFDDYPGFRFLKCMYGNRYCYLDSEGFMYPCIVRGIKNGPNIREVGVEEAWKKLADEPCASCSYIQHVEVNSLLGLNLKSVIKGAKYILLPGGKARSG